MHGSEEHRFLLLTDMMRGNLFPPGKYGPDSRRWASAMLLSERTSDFPGGDRFCGENGDGLGWMLAA